MGVDGTVRKFWWRRYPEALHLQDPTFNPDADPDREHKAGEGSVSVLAAHVGKKAPIVHFDYTNAIKIPPPKSATTWYGYLRESVLPSILNAYRHGASVVHVCFDRGSPPNKDAEQRKRQRNTVPMRLDEAGPIRGTGKLPPHERWRDFIGNKRLVLELLQYITHSLLDREGRVPQQNMGYVFKPPLGCKLFLHGGVLDLPPRAQASVPMRAPPIVYCVDHALQEDPVSGAQDMVCTSAACDPALFPEERVGNALEAEMACLLYSTYYPTANNMVVTPDGDLIPQMLMMARDRIDPTTGNFRNVHYIQLVGVGGGGRHNCEYIDVNQLYLSMLADSELQAAGVRDPVLTHCALSCLVKNDYIHGFAYGIGNHKDEEQNLTPHVFRAFYRDAARFASLFTSTCGPGGTSSGDLNAWRQPVIDEDLFDEFVQHVYVSKYETPAVKKLGGQLPPVIASRVEPVRQYLAKYRKNAATHMMPRGMARVFGRQLRWVLEYWFNNYRGRGAFESPTSRKGNLPFYGWVYVAGMHRRAERVSTERPSRAHALLTSSGAARGSPPPTTRQGGMKRPRSPALHLPKIRASPASASHSLSRSLSHSRLGVDPEQEGEEEVVEVEGEGASHESVNPLEPVHKKRRVAV